MAGYRRTDQDLAYGDDYHIRGGDRWDRERFERMRGARNRFRFEEQDDYGRGEERRDVRIEVDGGRSSRDFDRYEYNDGRFVSPRQARGEIVRFERRDYEDDRLRYEYGGPSRARPTLIRRQTSLDSYDRKPLRRYEDERDINVSLNVTAPDVRRFDDRYDDVRIRRELERDVYRRRRDSSVEEARQRRGTTKMPKRLVHHRAVLDLGHPYDEDEHFWYVRTSLTKVVIDETLERSKGYFRDTTTSVDVETKLLEAPPIPQDSEVVEVTTTKIIENPTDEEIAEIQRRSTQSRRSSSSDTTLQRSRNFSKSTALSVKSPSPSRHGHRGRSRSRPRGDEIIADSNDTLAVVLPRREKSRSRREIDEEIRRLELQKRSIRGRLDELSTTDDEYEIVDRKEIRVDRDDLGNLRFERDTPQRSKSRRRSRATQRDLNAALFSLT